MEKYKWIQDCGFCSEKQLKEIIRKYSSDNQIYIALHTDSFDSNQADNKNLESLNTDTLLEIRIFDMEHELYAARGTIGCGFSWRITSDENLEETDFIERKHYIDINDSAGGLQTLENGCKKLITTVGGIYSLPITTEKRIKIKSYITYDENGSAKIVDNRVCGFLD